MIGHSSPKSFPQLLPVSPKVAHCGLKTLTSNTSCFHATHTCPTPQGKRRTSELPMGMVHYEWTHPSGKWRDYSFPTEQFLRCKGRAALRNSSQKQQASGNARERPQLVGQGGSLQAELVFPRILSTPAPSSALRSPRSLQIFPSHRST